MQQTFPAGIVQKIVIPEVKGDLSISGWEQQELQITTEGRINQLQPEGNVLTIGNCNSDLTINVPWETMIVAGKIHGDARIEKVREIELDIIKGELILVDTGEVRVAKVGGDLLGKNGVAVLRAGSIGGDCLVRGNGNAYVQLENVEGDLAINGVSHFQVGNANGDCLVQESANAEGKISNVEGDLKILGAASLEIGNVGNDCELRDVRGDVSLGYVGSDTTILGLSGNLRMADIGSDAHLRGIGGSISVGNVGSDLYLQAAFPVDSEVRMNVGGDARIVLPKDVNLAIRAHVGGNVTGHSIVSSFSGNFINLVYGDGAAHLELNVGGDLSLQSNENPRSSSSTSGNASAWDQFGRELGREMNNLGREMEQLGRNLKQEIGATVSEVTSAFGSDTASNIAAAREQVRRAQREAEEQRRQAEQARQHAQREENLAGEHNPFFNVRIKDREWKMGSERIDAIVEQARKATSEGVQGAMEAVEQAFKNINVKVPPMEPMKPMAPMKPMEPMKPMAPMKPMKPMAPMKPMEPMEPMFSSSDTLEKPSVPLTSSEAGNIADTAAFSSASATANSAPGTSNPSAGQGTQGQSGKQTGNVTGKPANLDQEREAILRMIAEGRISPEEGDLLLEALGS